MTKINTRTILVGIALAAGTLGWAAPASAQLTRAWVSGQGNDGNPCSRDWPCRTFAGAISKVNPGGEINCLDPHSYGPVIITKSISIVCEYTGAGVSATMLDTAILINVAATDTVFLSGLNINGHGGVASPGLNGIRIIGGGLIHIQDSMIRNFDAAGAVGLRIAPSLAAQVTVSNTTISDNGGGKGGGGMLIHPTMAGAARVTMRNVMVQNNVHSQIRVDTTGNSGPGPASRCSSTTARSSAASTAFRSTSRRRPPASLA